LPLLKFESKLVCAPYRHGKTIIASNSPVNTVMTEHPWPVHRGPGLNVVHGSWTESTVFPLENKVENPKIQSFCKERLDFVQNQPAVHHFPN
jgi:hypothetical protein